MNDSITVDTARLPLLLGELRLPTIAKLWQTFTERADREGWPFVKVAFADSGYQGPRVAAASPIRVEIVRKLEGQVGFVVHARRGVVERFFAWINRDRRLAKDVETTIASAEAFLYAASAILLLRRRAR